MEQFYPLIFIFINYGRNVGMGTLPLSGVWLRVL